MPVDQGGGLSSGDTQYIDISISNHSSVIWKSPASTICYPPSEIDNQSNTISNTIEIKENSTLVFLNKPLIPCKFTKTNIKTFITIQNNCELLYLDILSAGRVAHQEEWQFQSIRNTLEFIIDKNLVYKENWHLKKNNIPMGIAGFQNAKMSMTLLAHGKKSCDQAISLVNQFNPKDVLIQIGNLSENTLIIKGLDPLGCYFTSINNLI